MIVALSLVFFAGSAHADSIELISRVHPSLIPDTGGGTVTSISSDGRYVVFQSLAGNLIPGQQSTTSFLPSQVFLYDRETGARILVSRTGSAVTTGNGSSGEAVVSADGRFVAFRSQATNLIPGLDDANETADVFLYDRVTGERTLVSRSSASATTAGNGESGEPVISADGAYVVFVSTAQDLVSGQSDAPETQDVFLFDRLAGTTTLISHLAPATAAGGTHPALSADGAWVAFISQANLAGDPTAYEDPNLFLYERSSGSLTLASRKSGEPLHRTGAEEASPSLSADGRYVAFLSKGQNLVAGQTESEWSQSVDVFVFDRVAGTMALATRGHASAVVPINDSSEHPALSADGRSVAFVTSATDVVAGQSDEGFTPDVFLHDLALGTTVLVSRSSTGAQTAADGPSSMPRISADGSFVSLVSRANDLIPGQGQAPVGEDLYLFQRATGEVRRVSQPAGGATPIEGREIFSSFLSADGSQVAYTGSAANLVAGVNDPGRSRDAFLYSRLTEQTSLVSRRDPGSPALTASGRSDSPLVSADGRFMAYLSNAPGIAPGQSDIGFEVVILYDRVTGIPTLVSPPPGFSPWRGNDRPYLLGLSADGRFVTYGSQGPDLIPGQVDQNNFYDVFSYDRISGTTALVSRSAASPTTAGTYDSLGGRPTPDGRYVPFQTWSDDIIPGQVDGVFGPNVFLHDRATGTTELVSHASGAPAREANGSSGAPAVSPDARYVAFSSSATDLVPGLADTNNTSDLFLLDRRTGTHILVSRSSHAPNKTANGTSGGPVFAGGGRCLVFISSASDLVAGGDDTNGLSDVFLYSLVTGQITLVSHAYGSATTGGNGSSFAPSTGDDCSAIAFTSWATDLVPGQAPEETADLFLAEPALGTTTLLVRSDVTPQTFGPAPMGEVSPDSRFIGFSTKQDLVDGLPGEDAYPYSNLYLFDRATRDFVLVSRAAGGSPATAGNHASGGASFSGDSRFIGFSSAASDLVAGDFNGSTDVFLFDNELALGGDFYTLSPCRLLDTRQPEDGPALVSGAPVIFEVDGRCGIPVTARALAVNVTVFEPTGQGNLSLSPGDAAPSGTSTINFLPGMNRANNAIVRLSLDGSASVTVRPLVVGGGTVHVILDVVGYFE